MDNGDAEDVSPDVSGDARYKWSTGGAFLGLSATVSNGFLHTS